MKIAIRGGHNYGVTGAHGILDEVAEDRKIYSRVIGYLKQLGHEVLDVTPDRTSTSAEDLTFGVSKANVAKVDYFASIHLNAGGGRGAEVLYQSARGKVIADRIALKLSELGFTNRGAKVNTRGLYELKKTTAVANIIECFFIDSEEDAALYNKVGVDAIAKKIVEGITGQIVTDLPKYPGYLIKYNPKVFNENVKLIQQKLGITSDGLFGNKTLIAIQNFQKAHGLQPDGIVGELTWNELF